MNIIPIHFFYLDLFFYDNGYYLYFNESEFEESILSTIFPFFKKNKKINNHHYFYIQFNSIDDIYVMNKVIYRNDYNDYTIKKQKFSNIHDLSYAIRCLNIQLQFSLKTIKEAQTIFINNYNPFQISFYTTIENNLNQSILNYLLQSDDSSFVIFNPIEEFLDYTINIEIFERFELNNFYDYKIFYLIQLLGFCFLYHLKLKIEFKHWNSFTLLFEDIKNNFESLQEYYFNDNTDLLHLIQYKELT